MRVEIGAVLPETTAPEHALPDVAGLARLAERAGLDCLRAEDRLVAIGGTPRQVAEHLARYAEAGAELLAVTCYPAPVEQSRELLAETRCLLNQP